MQYGLADPHFKTYEKIKKWLNEWIVLKNKHFSYCGSYLLLEKVIASDEKYFE